MMFRKDQRTRSPIKGKALREPGQSLAEQLEDLVYDRMLLWLLLPLLFGLLAGLEWWRWYREAPYNPLFYTVVAVLAALVSALRLIRLFRQARALKLGRDGERVVGQFLEDMRPDGYHVLHDLIGDGFNVDHVVIGERGVYTVETKTLSLPAKKRGTVTCDGPALLVNGRRMDRDPIGQAKAQAAWLSRTLKESTGRDYRVQPVVAFPGWFVERACQRVAGVWVLEPKALPSFIKQEPCSLSAEHAHMAATHLRKIIRATERLREGRRAAQRGEASA
ncbi:MAG: nuclease-related domain-containing protein [Thiohalocapsa sp.]